MHTYRKVKGENLWTVGFFTVEPTAMPGAKSVWHALHDYDTEERAMRTVCMLNGGAVYELAFQTGEVLT